MPRRGSVGENGIGVTSYPINDCTSLFTREKGTVRLRYVKSMYAQMAQWHSTALVMRQVERRFSVRIRV